MNFAPAMPFRAAEALLDVAVEPAFEFLGAEYRALQQRSCATSFQAPLWLDALHRDVGAAFGARPVTVTVRAQTDGRLMLVLPLTLRRERGVTTLEFADFGLCDYLAPVHDTADLPLLLADATLPERIAAALPRHDMLALTKLAGERTLLAHLFPKMRRAQMRISAYPAKLTSDWQTWRAEKLNSSVRRELDMKRRRLVRSGKTEFSVLRDAQTPSRRRSTHCAAIAARDSRRSARPTSSIRKRSSVSTAAWRSKARRTARRAPNAFISQVSRSPCSSDSRSVVSIRC